MDIRLECQGSEIDHRKPADAFFNYDGEVSPEMIKAHILGHICEYRDDLSNYDRARHKITLNLDAVMGEGVATVEIADEVFQIRLFVNPDISRGASVRVSSYEAPNHGAYGVLVDASETSDIWTVQMLDGGKVHYEREDLADLSRKTTIDGGSLVTAVEVPAAFEIGERVLYTAGTDSFGHPISEDKVVQITGRRYTPSTWPGARGAEWSYWAADVETGVANLALGELCLSKLPRNLQNLQIIQRQG